MEQVSVLVALAAFGSLLSLGTLLIARVALRVIRRMAGWMRANPAKAGLGLAGTGALAVAALIILPVLPLAASSDQAGQLEAVFAGADVLHYRIVCQDAPTSLLADYYADTLDYLLSDDTDRDYAYMAFGDEVARRAGLLTVKQAAYLVYFGAPLHAGDAVPANFGGGAIGAEGYCQLAYTPPDPSGAGYWINSLENYAVVTRSGCGTRAFVLRKLDGRWKMVRIQQVVRCPGLG
jgi:hypothetical protein